MLASKICLRRRDFAFSTADPRPRLRHIGTRHFTNLKPGLCSTRLLAQVVDVLLAN